MLRASFANAPNFVCSRQNKFGSFGERSAGVGGNECRLQCTLEVQNYCDRLSKMMDTMILGWLRRLRVFLIAGVFEMTPVESG